MIELLVAPEILVRILGPGMRWVAPDGAVVTVKDGLPKGLSLRNAAVHPESGVLILQFDDGKDEDSEAEVWFQEERPKESDAEGS